MHLIPLNIREEQKTFLFERKKKTNKHVSEQIREAIDDYMEKHKNDIGCE